MKKIFLLATLLLVANFAGAQELVVESFKLDPFDVTAATHEHEVLDNNLNPCALVKIMIIDNTVNFKSDWIIRIETRGNNEYWVYLCEGTQSITVTSDHFLPTEVVFSDYDSEVKGLKKKNTYVLKLSYKGEIQDGKVGVTFVCNSPVAEYIIDGYTTERNTNSFRIVPGEHTVEVTADGYRKLITTVNVNPYLKQQEISFKLIPDSGNDALVVEGDRYYGEKNYIMALELYRQAADKGNTTAMRTIGDTYYKGTGVEKDYAEALKWYVQGANKGDALCQCRIGGMYYWGKGVRKDYTQAAEWFSKAADQNYAFAQFCLGGMYLTGEGVSQDYTKVIELFSKAANQGYANAQYSLGILYYFGGVVSRDYSKAFAWFNKAAMQGLAPAQYYLGMMYYKGQEVRVDYEKAEYWYKKAASQGHEKAIEALKQL